MRPEELEHLITKAQGHHQRLVDHFFGNESKSKPLACIPANPDTDSDLIVARALRESLKLVRALKETPCEP